MRFFLPGLCAAVVAAVPTLALAQDKAPPPKEPAVYRLVIWNGPQRTIAYTGVGLSPGEESSLRELARAENEAALTDELLALKLKYTSDELFLENHRAHLQQLLYGYNTTYNASLLGPVGLYGGGWGGTYYYPWLPYGGGYGGAGFTGSFGSATSTLAAGVGYEGPIKSEMARTLAAEAAPHAAAQAQANLQAVRERFAAYEGPREKVFPKNGIRPVGFEQGAGPDTVFLRNGERLSGTIVKEDADWVTIDTGRQEVKVRAGEVVSLARAKKRPK